MRTTSFEHVHAPITGLSGKTVMVTGATGYLGSALIAALAAVPCRIVTTTRGRGDQGAGPGHTMFVCDFERADAWAGPLAQARPDVIFHLAAYEHRRGSPHAPALDATVNAGSVLHLLETCVRLGNRPRIVLASSANLVGRPARLPVTEETPDQPLTLYAIHKLTAERYLHFYAQRFGIPSVALRLSNVYGHWSGQAREVAGRVVLNRIMLQALAGEPITLFANSECRRDFVHLSDVIAALSTAAVHPDLVDGDRYLVAGGEDLTIRNVMHLVAAAVAETSHRRPEIRTDAETPLEPIEWRDFVADCGKLRRATGWTPHVRLRDGIEATVRALSAD